MKTDKRWIVGVERFPRPLQRFEIDPRRTALLIVDMQNYLRGPEVGLGKIIGEDLPEVAAYYYPRVREMVVPNNVRLLELFRSHGLPVVFTSVGPELPDGSDLPRWRRIDPHDGTVEGEPRTRFPYYSKAAWERQIIDELKPSPTELVLYKNTSGAFNSTAIDHFLRNMGIEGLVVTGIATNFCVETTARDAADRGYKVVLVDDACSTFDQASHDATMRSFVRIYGLVRDTDEILADFGRELGG